jgi:uncharacterized repeat protein (TIGR01451 family)
MRRGVGFASITGLLALLLPQLAYAQTGAPLSPSRAVITDTIDERNLVRLPGNTRPEVTAANDRGAVPDGFRMAHMLLQLRHPPERETALQEFLRDIQDPGSPTFHKWINSQQFGQNFGLAQQDIDAITQWLESHGLTVNVVYPSRMLIDFSGTARGIQEAFHTDIHVLDVRGETHIANTRDPEIPSALVPAVVGIVSLHDFRPHVQHEMHKPRANYTFSDILGDVNYAMVPADLATIYNLTPLFNSGYSGQGQTIAVIEDTDVFQASDWSTFRSTFGLSSYTSGSFSTSHPIPSNGTNNCADPGVVAPNDAEAILDAEWASAAAPNAAISITSCGDTTTTFGGLIALENLINSSSQPPGIVSISYGECEAVNGESANATYNATYQQAVSEGISVFVAAGDSGAAGCDNSATNAIDGIGVNAFASTAYNVAVGGTDFIDTYSKTNNIYWSSANGTTLGSALSYIPEIPWNDSCAGTLLSSYFGSTTSYGSNGFCNTLLGGFYLSTVAGGGGPSACATGSPLSPDIVSGSCQGWPKPSWQSGFNGFGNPNDGVRDTPDISLFAADGLWSHYYIFCWSDSANGGAACGGAPNPLSGSWSGAGGTSFASPIMAGIQALVNQKTGERQGNPNPTYYQLAATEYLQSSSSCDSANGNGVANTCIFYDITQGDENVNCTGTNNCYVPSGPEGVLSTQDSSYDPAYTATMGWDFATGIGSVNAFNLVNSWPVPLNGSALTITKTHNGNFTEGQQQASYTVTVSNGTNAMPTNGPVNVTESLPSGLSLVAMTGTGWTCTANTCARSDAVNGGTSYPPITVLVNVAFNASSPLVNTVMVSGGGSPPANATDSTVVTPIPAILSITKTHSGSFTQGQQNATYAVTVSNGAVAGPTSGTVTVLETIPPGLTLVSMTGAGWTCGANACTRNDTLNGGSSYPTITVAVNVASNASSPQVNQVSVSGGGSAIANTTDSTSIVVLAVANFIGTDITTEGTWHGVYGANGYSIANSSQSIPTYAVFAVQNQLNYTWASSTTDPRALQTASGTTRIAATWYSSSSFNFDVNFVDGNLHQMAFYALDWDRTGRAETVQVVDANTGMVLDTRNISNFANGLYLVWNLGGHVKVKVTRTSGPNAVISGAFFR